jgi:hypothetical protein
VFIELVRVSELQLYAAFFAMESGIFEGLLEAGESDLDPLAFATFGAHCENSAGMSFIHGIFSFFILNFGMREGYALSRLEFSTRPADPFFWDAIRRCSAGS